MLARLEHTPGRSRTDGGGWGSGWERSGSDKVCRSKRHKLSILGRCSGAGEHAKRRQIRNVGSQLYRRSGSLGVDVAACCSRQKSEQMRRSADQDISTGPEECWTPARAHKQGSQKETSIWAQETDATPNKTCLRRQPVTSRAKSSYGKPFLLICKGHKLDHTVASLGHLLPIMGTAGPCGCLLHKCFQLRKEKVGQCLPLVLSAPGCQE